MSFDKIESYITKFPLYQYAFIKSDDIDYSEKVRQICKRTCGHYRGSWSCPPAIGKIEKCKERCLRYSDVLVISTVTELEKGTDKEIAESQIEHEKLTDIIREYIMDQGNITYVLTSGWCRKCEKCSFPKDFCKHPYEMHPCIESHGIIVSDLMEQCEMDYYLGGNLYLLFSLIFFRSTDFSD